MNSGLPAKLESVEIVNDIAEPVFTIIPGSQAVTFCRSSRDSIGLDRLVRDPYEARTVEVFQDIKIIWLENC